MRMIDADALCKDLLDRWNIADSRKEELIRAVMADIVTPIIACQPTINQWISVSERLPGESGAYICSCKDGNRDMVSMVRYQPRQKSWNLTGQRAYWRVIAWMPLPEPWKGEE